jgi:spore coat polysaccharide biosynthesis predicted glycosyltransferase SpsG
LAKELTPLIVVLDNDENQFFKVAALINHNINQDAHFYDGVKDVPCYIGSDYVPLCRKKLENAKLRQGSRFNAEDIVVTFGGTNPNNLTLKVLQALHAIDPVLRVSVVLGRGTPADICDKIRHWMRESGNCWNFYHGLSHEDFLELLASSRCAVSAPGNTLYELCYLGIPTLAIAENEATLRVANAFASRGWCRSIGLGTKLPQGELIMALQEFIDRDDPINSRRTCSLDGRGVGRIIDVILNVIAERHGIATIARQ